MLVGNDLEPAADHVQQFTERYNASAGPIGDHCVVVSVKPADSDAVIDGFIGKWPAELGQRPALWIPASSVSTSRLTARMPVIRRQWPGKVQTNGYSPSSAGAVNAS